MAEAISYKTVDLAQIRAAIEAERSFLDTNGVMQVDLIGSHARGDHTTANDVDFLLDLPLGHNVTALQLLDLQQRLEMRLAVKVDLVFQSMLKPHVLANMQRDAVRLI